MSNWGAAMIALGVALLAGAIAYRLPVTGCSGPGRFHLPTGDNAIFLLDTCGGQAWILRGDGNGNEKRFFWQPIAAPTRAVDS